MSTENQNQVSHSEITLADVDDQLKNLHDPPVSETNDGSIGNNNTDSTTAALQKLENEINRVTASHQHGHENEHENDESAQSTSAVFEASQQQELYSLIPEGKELKDRQTSNEESSRQTQNDDQNHHLNDTRQNHHLHQHNEPSQQSNLHEHHDSHSQQATVVRTFEQLQAETRERLADRTQQEQQEMVNYLEATSYNPNIRGKLQLGRVVSVDGPVRKCSRCRVKRLSETPEELQRYQTCLNCRFKRRVKVKRPRPPPKLPALDDDWTSFQEKISLNTSIDLWRHTYKDYVDPELVPLYEPHQLTEEIVKEASDVIVSHYILPLQNLTGFKLAVRDHHGPKTEPVKENLEVKIKEMWLINSKLKIADPRSL
ncbi:unnamed protein product [Ambrosiozyma monospora]|uniref:Unnamed protein product n=1 Tax=Ambrosiozyma monospora TaxID=43982 RepID=A0ACB5SY90_AMBMO|nr:unnamed protein product [Ambrosiozyma monospora]